MGDIEKKEEQFPVTVMEAGGQLKALEETKKRIEGRIKALRHYLRENITEKTCDEWMQKTKQTREYRLGNVVKKVTLAKGSTDWRSVYEEVKDKFVPKTKYDECKEVVKENTGDPNERVSFDVIEEEEGQDIGF